MKNQYEKRKAVFQTIIFIFMIVVFATVWINFYNAYMFQSLEWEGAVVAIVIFIAIYAILGRIYHAFEIGVYQIGETAFSQIISVFFADVVLYLQCCLVFRQYVDLRPGLIAFAVQVAGAIIWAYSSKNYYINNVSPSSTIIIRGTDELYSLLTSKLYRRYTHVFNIEKQISQAEYKEEGISCLSEYSAIMLYEVDESIRTEIIKYCFTEDKMLFLTPSIQDLMFKGFEARHYVDTPLWCYSGMKMIQEDPFWKRSLDIFVASVCLLIFSPIMLLTAIAIKIEDGGPVFFRQERITKNANKFNMIKFRSMIVNAERPGEVIPFTEGDARVTRCGRFIRRYRIDELPQFINVLKGEMSVVGPRPERVETVEQYTAEVKEFHYRHAVKTGLTGYAQVYGKYNTSAKDKLKLDLMYIQNLSVINDMKIILLTIKTIIYSNGTDGFDEVAFKKHSVRKVKKAEK